MNTLKPILFLLILLFFNLSAAGYSSGSWDYRLPDEIGNLTEKESTTVKWRYQWSQSGMLKKVIRPDRKHVDFTYDALGRRLTKTFKEETTHFVWDGNVPLHEWTSQLEETISIINDKGEKEINIPENLTTWIFEDGTFIPMAKLQGRNSFSIVTDYLGTPIEAYSEDGKKVWSRQLSIYGETRKETGSTNFVPYLYQGQYLDVETDLAYNRFRYYSPESGTYISQDKIRLSGGSRLYEYSKNTTLILDPFGLLDFYHATNGSSSTDAVMGGIDPSKGRPNLDFNPSGEGGFYVTNDLDQAQSWADRKGGDVIHFDVPDDELADLNIKTFDSATDEWADTVTAGRKGTLNHAFDGVDGPMLRNPGRGKPKPMGHQLAIFTDKAAKLFDKHNKGKLPC